MTVILLLLHLTSVCAGKSAEKTTYYQAEEEDNITMRWDSQNQTDLSLTNMICFLLSKHLKVLYELINGVEFPESQHQQFSGRVQCDRDALREGRVTLHLSRLTAADSGRYRCKMVHYDKTKRTWELRAEFPFVLNVIQTSHGETFISHSTTQSGLIPVKGAEQPVDGRIIAVILLLPVSAVGGYVAVTVFRCKKQNDEQKKDTALVERHIKYTNENQLNHLDSDEQNALKTSLDV